LVGRPLLLLAIGICTGVGVLAAALVGALTFAVTRDRGMTPADLGFILSAYGAGNLLGALLGGRFTHGRLAPLLLGGYFIQGAAILAIGVPMTLPLWLLLLIAFAGGFGSGLTIVA